MISIKKLQRMVWGFALRYVPMILICRPKIIDVSKKGLVIKIPLYWFTKNHVGSMYFGALAVGCDLACGLLAMIKINESGHPLTLIFKSTSGQFLQRAEKDVIFVCEDGIAIENMIQKAIDTNDRVTEPCRVNAYIDLEMKEHVATFEMELSVRSKKR